MPLKISKGANRSPNYRIRGTVNGVRIDQSAGTSNLNEARQALKKLEFQIKSGAIRPKSSITSFAKAMQLYVAETKNERFIGPLLEYFGEKDITTITQ